MWGTGSQCYGLARSCHFSGKWIGLGSRSRRGSRRGGDVAGAILDPQNTVGNKQIRPLASVLVECSGWDVSPRASLKLLSSGEWTPSSAWDCCEDETKAL